MTLFALPSRKPAWQPLALASAISLLFSAAPSPAFAQTGDIKSLPTVVVTASRIEQAQTEALSHTTVITQEMIRERQASDVVSLLRSEAGVEIAQNGGAGSVTSLFMRGAESRQNLVLIDGIPIRDATELGTAAALQNILPDQIERIEIVRGNVSAIYGSGAIGGVIQIFTKQGYGEPVASMSAEVGSRGTTKLSGGLSGKSGDTRYMLSLTRYATDGFSAMNTVQNPTQNPDKDGDRNVSVAAALSHEWSRDQELGVRAYVSDAKYKFDGGYATSSIENGLSRQQTFAAFSKNRLAANWLSTLTVSKADTRREALSAGGAWGGAYDYENRYKSNTSILQWSNDVMLAPGWVLIAGADKGRERADVYAYSPNALPAPSLSQYTRSRSNASLYAGLNGKVDAHSLQVNLRHDRVGGSGAETTGYLGYGYALSPAWKLVASTSTAFLAPNLYQLYDPTNGNPNLKAERAKSREVGLQYADGHTLVRATLFQSRTRDMINWMVTDWDTYAGQYFNVDKASNRGLELSASARIVKADVRASLTLQDPKDDTTGLALTRRAKTVAALSLSQPFGSWRVGGDVQYVGRRFNSTFDDTVLPSYWLVNTHARYLLNKEMAVYARIENLLNRHYQTAYGYNQPPRGVFAGVEWRQ